MIDYLHHFSGMVLWRPDVFIGLLLFGIAYAGLAGPLCPDCYPMERVRIRRGMLFAVILAILYIGMGSPLSLLAERAFFTAYVVQMVLLTQVVPPLLFLALPDSVFEALATAPIAKRILRIVRSPMVALTIYNGLASACLLPDLFQASLSNDLLHFVLSGSLMLSAVFLWWPLMSRTKSLPRLTPGAELVYLLFAGNLMMPIAVFLFFSTHPWYEVYVSARAPVGAFPPLEDQQVGALVMVLGMLLVYTIRALPAFFSYSESSWYE